MIRRKKSSRTVDLFDGYEGEEGKLPHTLEDKRNKNAYAIKGEFGETVGDAIESLLEIAADIFDN